MRVAHGERFLLVVGDVEEGGARAALKVLELGLHLAADLLVERRQRLVEQEDRRPGRQRARHRDALLLAAAQERHVLLLHAGEPDQVHQLLDALLPLAPRHASDLEPVGHVLRHRHVREDRVLLEHHAEVAPPGRDRAHVLPLDEDAGRNRAWPARR